MADFANLVRNQRQSLGYVSAYRFFKEKGGASVVGCTYKFYLNIEQGKYLPGADMLPSLLRALEVYEKVMECAIFMRAYLNRVITDRHLQEVIRSTGDPAAAVAPAPTTVQDELLLDQARDRMRRFVTLSESQMQVVLANRDVYWIFMTYQSGPVRVNVDKISERMAIPVEQVREHCQHLVKAGLLKRIGKGRFMPVYEDVRIPTRLGEQPVREIVDRYNQEVIQQYGERCFGRTYTMCSTHALMQNFIIRARDFTDMFLVYENRDDEDSRFWVMETKVIQLF